MSSHRYSPEFKDEAVRQVTERGYSVKEVSARLGISSHSLYKSPANLAIQFHIFGQKGNECAAPGRRKQGKQQQRP